MPFLTKQTEEILKTEGGGKLFLKAKSLFSLWMSHFSLVNRNEKLKHESR